MIKTGRWIILKSIYGRTVKAWFKAKWDEWTNLWFNFVTPILNALSNNSKIEKKWYELKSSCVFEMRIIVKSEKNNRKTKLNFNKNVFLL